MSEEIKEDKPSLKIIKFEPRKTEKVEVAQTEEEATCDQVLQAALSRLSTVVIVGYTKEDYEYYASSIDDSAEIVWLLERMKKFLLDQADGE
jgi:hypothetical protein